MNPISRKIRLLLVPAIVLLASKTTPVVAQSAVDGFDPNANGAVQVVVVQPDGKILIGGQFTTVAPNGGAPVTRNRIARLNADGTLDMAFNPNANNTVWSIAVQADGKILVGGDFNGTNSIGGQARNRIARLEPIAGSADSFDPNANNTIRSIAVQGDGKILVGGFFAGANSIGGQPRNRIARLDAATGLADSFNPNANGAIFSMALQTDGKILAGGLFTNIGGQARNNLARLDAVSGLADSFDPNINSIVFAVAVQADGRVLAGGSFTSAGGQTRNNIARFDATTGAPDSFNPNANGGIFTMAVQADGKILTGGDFNGANSIGGAARNRIARLDPITGLADSFDPNANNTVNSIVVQADGSVLTGGFFIVLTSNGGAAVTRNRMARLKPDGRLDKTLDLSFLPSNSRITTIAAQPDGKIIIGGTFTSVSGVTRNMIARLNPDGSLDTAFNPNADAEVRQIVVQTDGKILVGGSFTTIGGQARNHIARLDAVTGAADLFNPNASDDVISIAIQADGKILAGGPFMAIGGEVRNFMARLDAATGFADSFDPNPNGISVDTIVVQANGSILVGGFFTSIGGQLRNNIARLDAATGLADSFDPNANASVFLIALQPDGKILVTGSFNGVNSIGGQTRNRIARLEPVAGAADSFDPNANSNVLCMAIQADGKILVGGTFFGANSIGGQTRNRIARLDPLTGLADSFDPNSNGTLNAVVLQPDGKILVGGIFSGTSSIGGQSRNKLARLQNDTIATQDLAATQTTVTWARGGSSPQFKRVTFESSIDNVNYTFLGNGAPAGSNWRLTGLNLATGQNIYIRGRGYYGGSVNNASESIQESVRNAFITLPPMPTQVVSRKLHGGTPFDVVLPLTGNLGIECRSGGANNDYQIVLSFPNAVTFTVASVTSGAGSVSSINGSGTNIVTINLTGVSNAQHITVTLSGVSDGTNTGDINVSMGMLIGDTSGNGTVNASDVSLTKLKSGQPVDATNFRNDVTGNGSINASDVSLVKSKSGTALP